jgi:hypothetical protein
MKKYKGYAQVSVTAVASATATASGSATSSGSATATATATSKLSQESANEKAYEKAITTANKDALSDANYNAKIDAYNNALKEVKKQLFPSVGALKTVFLLELSAGIQSINDNNIKETLEYYWNNYPEEFTRCPIEDTKGSMEILFSLLDKYYAAGYKIFVGFSQATTFEKVLGWFNNRPDATGMSVRSGSKYLNSIPKNIYRTTNSNNIRVTPIIPYIEKKTVYYIYEDGLPNPEITNEDLQKMVSDGLINKLFSYKGTITLDNMKEFFININTNDVIITYLYNDSSNNFINCFNKSIYGDNRLDIKCDQYNLTGVEPDIPIGCQDILNEIYNLLESDGVGSSILYRNGLKTIGKNFLGRVVLRVLLMLIIFKNNQSNGCCNSHFGITEFDPGTKTILFNNSIIKLLKNGVFIPNYLYVEDPYIGTYTANFLSKPTVPQNYIPMNPRNVFGKAVALLEINNPNLNFDTILNYAIYYYWNYDKTLPRFPIINTYTEGDNDAKIIKKNIDLLNSYYHNGYRIFFGFSRSTILKGVNDWFANHTDTVALSGFSTSIDSVLIDRKNTNLYRLQYSDNYIVDSILRKIKNTYDKIFYFYSGNENAAINIKNYIAENETGEFLSYNIDAIGNYTASSINDFFRENGVTENSVVILYIFDEQKYYDLYNSPDLKNYSKRQYSILNQSTPIITGAAQEKLNGLNYILTASPNTSQIWRGNAAYLSEKFNSDTNSSGLLDALKMIEYLQNKKPTNLLGSHSGILQFNDKGDRMFPSYLQLTYKKETNTFVNNSILFDDPLLGKFNADL